MKIKAPRKTWAQRRIAQNKTIMRKINTTAEHLVECAIERGGELHHGFHSHAELRRQLGDRDPYKSTPGDLEGFYTNTGRFVGRCEGRTIAALAGQSSGGGRELLSSDVDRWK